MRHPASEKFPDQIMFQQGYMHPGISVELLSKTSSHNEFFFNLNSCDQMEVLKILDDTSEEDDSDCCGCRQEPPDKKEDQYHLFNSINREYSDTTANFESNSTQFWL